MRVGSLVLILSLLSTPAAAQELVLHAQPTVKVESSETGTMRVSLTASEAQTAQILITKRQGRYFWASRDHRELFYHPSGIYHFFLDPIGAGYIKVEDQNLLPESLRDPNPSFRYYEHLNQGLATITYWGSTDSFSP
jgi:hypothetical protein